MLLHGTESILVLLLYENASFFLKFPPEQETELFDILL